MEEENLIRYRNRSRSSSKSRNNEALIKWIRGGGLELAVPLFVLGLLSISVLVYNFLMKLNVVDPCETNRYAKHFYCFNKSDSPGVHVDNDVRL